ncbi:ankyrin repeat domain-containing protein [Pontibacter vulgaris]|uniref:ankyrin repeat domain-containing protein n=1 Tax=Pontibacter vulgaris TaxID=2905679 RepID=UPI001FA732A9|nr:ankyrin repeat domain-containing protein [Pontibacter vulgaris]
MTYLKKKLTYTKSTRFILAGMPDIRYLLLLLAFILMSEVSMAQTKTPAKNGAKTTKAVGNTHKKKKTVTKKTAKVTAKTKKQTGAITADTKPETKAPGKLIWRTPAMQEALGFYTDLKFEQAYSKFKDAAAAGDADAYYFLGRMHQYRELKYDSVQIDTLKQIQNSGKYFSANTDSANFYFEQALDNNSMLGHLGVAELMTLRTQEDKQNFLEHMHTAAVVIREKAVEGDAFCNRILGSMYFTGYGELLDKELAFNYISRAASKGDAVSYCFLANMYLEGDGVKKDNEKAVNWLKKGVAAGDREALYTLGLLYEEGTLGEPNLDEARKLYRAAISKGSINAYEQLKYMNQTPDQKLVIAAITRNPDMLKRAITAGANVNTVAIPDDFGTDLRKRTPLMHTVYIPLLLEENGVVYEPEVRVHTLSQLLKKKADVNAKDQDGRTALHLLVSGTKVKSELFELEQVQLIDSLLKHGADPNLKDADGNTAIGVALQSTIGQHIGIMELERLLAAGANPNLQNNEGKTPLMLACEIDANFEIILALLQAGADAKLRDANGKAAIDYTKHENVTNILMAAGSPQKQ